MAFLATVISNDLPHESRLCLDGSNVVVAITVKYAAVTPKTARLTSEEIFTFKGRLGKIIGFFAQPAIRRAHRRRMEAFKRFAEHPHARIT